MNSKAIKNLILNYDITEELLKEYLREDFKSTIIAILHSIEELLKYYHSNRSFLEELLSFLEGLLQEELEIKNLKILHGELKSTLTNIYKFYEVDKNAYLIPILNWLRYLKHRVKEEMNYIDNQEIISLLEKIILEKRDLKLMEGLIKENKNILKIKNKSSENILYRLLKRYNSLDRKNLEEIHYLYQVLSLFINSDALNTSIIQQNDYYCNALKIEDERNLEIISLLEAKKRPITISELESRYHVLFYISQEAELELYQYQIQHHDVIDMTNQYSITIDDPTAKCLDDAVYLERNSNGTFTLYVHITRIPAIIPYESIMNKESIERVETRYLSDGTCCLYSDYISNYLASLLPNNVRHTETGIWLLDPQLNIIDGTFQIVKSKICSHQRLSYEEADSLIDKNSKNSLNEMLYLLGVFALKRRKSNRVKEVYRQQENLYNPDMKHESFLTDQLISANIVQETALLFSQYKAELYKKKSLPYIFRACETIPELSLTKANLNRIDHLSHMAVSAYYTNVPTTHHGLGFAAYAHTTSPARRSADGQNQYIDEDLIFNSNVNDKLVYQWEQRTQYLAKHYNETIPQIDRFTKQYNYLRSKKLINSPFRS